ncbi:leucyl aminopeptidase [Sphingomonas abietis]|uniref:Probable cytosol aminopeptidase n=1 Tax=Sphingomonas abietis TaxID=3012344 RepID=A0ABY7NRG5_9SPHN|nr:leucyl aminopeptidase [Sphingomonas abietis]WBO24147.1 leucyl aminopeptidase [Sphingomonas abietis]
MHVRFADRRPEGLHALVIPLTGGKPEAGRLAPLSGTDADFAARAATAARFEGDAGAIADLFVGDGRILLVGLGDGDSDKAYEKAGGALIAKAQLSEKTLVIDFSGHQTSADRVAALALGAALRNWRYDLYRTKLKASQKPVLEEIVIVGAGEGAEAAWAKSKAIADGVAFTKELVTEPANIIYPESFVERCQKLKDLGVEITVLDEAEMARLGMGSLLGVAQGSRKPARLLVLRWKGSDADPVAFVGKGVTFDTGGISIKPAAGMEDMKWDMGGAGAVAGAMMALAGRKAKAHVIGVCGLVENMPDGNAQRPGDVVMSMSGQTIEVINTDAEGRLVLCDAITWVQRTHGVKTIVDLATLTGAMIVALGTEYGGLFANDDGLAGQLLEAADVSGDKMWRFPLGDAYDKLIDSPIADMKNVGPRGGGSITAAQFIKRFVEDGVKWAHLDIAGMVWSAKAGTTYDKGATGFGVRLLDRFVADHLEA